MSDDGERDALAERFDENRTRLLAVAYRMLGSRTEAEDAVQEVWLRLSRVETEGIDSLGAWLTTVVARVCLDILRARRSRREDLVPEGVADATASESDPEREVALADALGPALLIVLDTLPPAERVAFVLHDMFDVPFDDIAGIVGRSPEAARQLASRARRRVRGGGSAPDDRHRRQGVVQAFLAASRDGDLDALIALLSPDALLRADELAVRTAEANRSRGAPTLAPATRGAPSVADTFKGRARGAAQAIIDGEAGAVWVAGDRIRAAFVFTVEQGKITEIEIVMDPGRLSAFDVEITPAPKGA